MSNAETKAEADKPSDMTPGTQPKRTQTAPRRTTAGAHDPTADLPSPSRLPVQRAADIATSAQGAPQRARMTAALQRAAGNTRTGAMLGGSTPATASSTGLSPTLRRPLEPPNVQRSDDTSKNLDESIGGAIEQRRGGGAPLPGGIRNDMEGAFGEDFSDVRIHNDSHAHELSRSVHARAFTVGNDVFFKKGMYDTSSTEGTKLLAHELTHVVQQDGASGTPTTVSDPHDASERAADLIAEKVIAGRDAVPVSESAKVARQSAGTAIVKLAVGQSIARNSSAGVVVQRQRRQTARASRRRAETAIRRLRTIESCDSVIAQLNGLIHTGPDQTPQVTSTLGEDVAIDIEGRSHRVHVAWLQDLLSLAQSIRNRMRTPQQRAALIQDVLAVITANEVGGRKAATESRLGTSSGHSASYASATQMTPRHALPVLERNPEYAQRFGLSPTDIGCAKQIIAAVVRLWEAIAVSARARQRGAQGRAPQLPDVVERTHTADLALTHFTRSDLDQIAQLSELLGAVEAHISWIPVQEGSSTTRRRVDTEEQILVELDAQRQAALTRLDTLAVEHLNPTTESGAGSTGAATSVAGEEPSTTPRGASEDPSDQEVPVERTRSAITGYLTRHRVPRRFRIWQDVVLNGPIMPSRLVALPPSDSQRYRRIVEARERWLRSQRSRLERVDIRSLARAVAEWDLADRVEYLYRGLGTLDRGDVARYARGNASGEAPIWHEDMNGWIRVALDRELLSDGRSLDSAISAAASEGGGYELSRIQFTQRLGTYLDANPTATDQDVLRAAIRIQAGHPGSYFQRIWPRFQRIRRSHEAQTESAQ